MDELLKKRLVGAAVLLFAALLLTFLLPKPGEELPLEPGWKRVILRPGEPLQVTPPPQVAAGTGPEAPVPVAEPEPAPVPATETAVSETEPEPALAALPESDPPPATVPDAEPEPKSEPKPEAKPASKPELKPKTQVDGKPETKLDSKPEPKPSPPAAEGSRWFVQLGSFSDIANARQLLKKFEPMGFKGVIAPIESAKGTLYRVRLGPFKDRAGGESALARTAEQGVAEAKLVQD